MGTVSPSTIPNSKDITGLDLCTTYWFVARAAICGADVFSPAFQLELQDAILFTLDFDLSGLGECNAWIATDNALKISAIEQTFNNTVYSMECGLILVDCFAGSALSCSANDPSLAIFRYAVVLFSFRREGYFRS